MAASLSGVVLVVRTGLPNRRAVIFLGIGASGVFFGKSDKAVPQHGISGIAGETAAALGLFTKME